MTLVTAFKSTGVPTMIGDFLISSATSRGRGRKKIARLRPNLAVGWTGRLLQAEMVLDRLYASLDESPTRDDVERLLQAFDVAPLGTPRLKLVGWVVDKAGPHAFHWDAASPYVHWGAPWFVGTGAAWMENAYDRYAQPSAEARPDERDGMDWVLGTLCELNVFDFLYSPTHHLGFGGGYEALYWSREVGSFRYVERTLYFCLGAWVDDRGKMTGPPIVRKDDVARYQTIDEWSVITLSRPVDGSDYQVWGMSPVGVPTSADDVLVKMQKAADGPMNMEADYYAAAISVGGPGKITPMVPFLQHPWLPGTFSGGPGSLEVKLSSEVFEIVYQQLAISHAGVPRMLRPLQDLLRGR
jgi:hypothetical protein